MAEIGHEVICFDIDRPKIASLKRGRLPIFELGLQKLAAINQQAGRLKFSSNLMAEQSREIDVYFIAVGTPTNEADGSASLNSVYSAADQIGRAISRRSAPRNLVSLVVTKSTVPVGTSRIVERILEKHLDRNQFAVASNPEFLREGSAVADFMAPDRIIIGSASCEARTILQNLYDPLVRKGTRLLAMASAETAELTKYAANAFLATKVTFINELSQLCEKTGVDIGELADGMGLDRRIGDKFLSAGPGIGGSCFPKDTRALIRTARDFKCSIQIVEAAVRANDAHKEFVLEKIRKTLGGRVAGKQIAVLGLSFKANTDDIRDSPAIYVVSKLAWEGAEIRAYDPIAASKARKVLTDSRIVYSPRIADAVTNADAAVILTEWDEFRTADWRHLAKLMYEPTLIDFRNLFPVEYLKPAGVNYISLGRPGKPDSGKSDAGFKLENFGCDMNQPGHVSSTRQSRDGRPLRVLIPD